MQSRTTAIAVVWRRENGDDLLVVMPAEPLHHELMRSNNELQPVLMRELLGDVFAKGVPGPITPTQHE